MDFFEMAYTRLDCNWLVVAYRCYSGSDRGPDGSPTPNQEGMMIDADAIAEFIQAEPRINKNKVFAHGRSLGGAVVVHLAAKQSRDMKPLFTGIVVESTFTSISDMAD
jgi:predicted alpha/beta-fold hydrolase